VAIEHRHVGLLIQGTPDDLMNLPELPQGSTNYDQSPSAVLAVVAGKSLFLWNTATASMEETFARRQLWDRPTGGADSVSWNHNGQVLAVSHRDTDTVALIEAKTGKTLKTITVVLPETATFGGKSRLLSVLENRRSSVSVWDLKKREPVHRLELEISGNNELPSQSCIDPSDNFVCTLSPLVVSFYHIHDGRRVAMFRCPDSSTASNANSSALEIGYCPPSCTWTCWDMLRSETLGFVVALGTSVGGVVIVSSAGLTASASLSPTSTFGGQSSMPEAILTIQQVIDHSLSTSTPLLEVSLLASPYSSTSSGPYILCALSTNAVAVYDYELANNGLKRVFLIPLGREDPATAMSWNGGLIAVGFASGAVSVLDWRSQDQRCQRFVASTTSLPIRQLRFGPNEFGSTQLNAPLNQVPNVSTASSPSFVQSVTPSLASTGSIATFPEGAPAFLRHSASSLSSDGNAKWNPELLKQVPLNRDMSLEAMLQPVTQHDLQQLRNDVRVSLVALQVEMMRQLQLQSDELNRLISNQSQLLNQVLLENRSLRAEINQLRRGNSPPGN
jgi:WD40 repeat protein